MTLSIAHSRRDPSIPLKGIAGFLLVILISFMGAFSSPAFADSGASTNAVVDLGKGNATAGAVATQVNRSTNTTIMKYDSSTGILSFDNDQYAQMASGDRRDYMKTSLRYIKDSSLTTMSKNKMFNFVADQDTTSSSALRNLETDSQSDLIGALTIFKPFSGAVGTVMGVIILAVYIFLAIGAVIDLAYIVIPTVRLFFGAGEGDKPKHVSREAYISVRDAEEAATYKSAMSLYLKRRAMMLLAIGILLLYLISGQIYGLFATIFDAFRPLLDQLNWFK